MIDSVYHFCSFYVCFTRPVLSITSLCMFMYILPFVSGMRVYHFYCSQKSSSKVFPSSRHIAVQRLMLGCSHPFLLRLSSAARPLSGLPFQFVLFSCFLQVFLVVCHLVGCRPGRLARQVSQAARRLEVRLQAYRQELRLPIRFLC